MRLQVTASECCAAPLLMRLVGRARCAFFADEVRAEGACSAHASVTRCSAPVSAPEPQEELVRAEHPGAIPPPAESSVRSLHSERAERVWVRPMARPLAKARSEFARRFDAAMSEHWVRGEEAYSNTAVARACKVNEKTVREWRLGEKRIPPEAIALLPGQLFEETVAILESLRSKTPKRAVIELRKSLTDLESQIAHEDPHEVVKALDAAAGRIAELRKKAVGVK